MAAWQLIVGDVVTVVCRDKKKFGGTGKKKQCCLKRRCMNMFSSGILFCCQSLNINLPDLGTTIEQSPAELALPKVSKEQLERVCSLLGLTCSSK